MAARSMSRMIIFDDGLGQLGPMTDLRAVYEVRTGMYTTAGRIRACWPKNLAGYWVPERLATLVASRADAPVNVLPAEEVLFLVNGRLGMPDPDMDLDVGTAAIEESTGHVVAAHLPRATAESLLTTGELHERVRSVRVKQGTLYKYPWDILALAKETIPADIASVRLLDHRVTAKLEIVGGYPVEVHRQATVGPGVVFDAELGSILVHENAVIRPQAVLCGPCSIGAGSVIVDRAHIKPNTVIGPMCKIGGEVGGTLFQGYANKGHEGHLGDSWVGKWVNLGAGTTNSNLLNTYGPVTMCLEPEGARHRTGQTFLGAVIGDHVKTAILTRLMTGSVIGTGAMIASALTPPTTVPAFAWLTDAGERVYRLGKFVDVMTTVMARRERTPSPEYLEAIKALFVTATPASVE